MYFIGGGLGGRGTLPADNTPAQPKTPLTPPPPKTPPFLKFGSGGVFKHDIRFPRIPPPPPLVAPLVAVVELKVKGCWGEAKGLRADDHLFPGGSAWPE